jgi:DNA-binding GntR family transcriptional regulator
LKRSNILQSTEEDDSLDEMTSAAGIGYVSSSDQLVRDIVRGLYEGRFVAGQRLVEPDLVTRYKIGRSTVREAIKRLTAEGIVTVLPFRGAQIRQLTREEARNILLILELLVGLAARMAAEKIQSGDARDHFARTYRDLISLDTRKGDFEFVLARNRFYRAMVSIGGNTDLQRLFSGLQVHLVRSVLKRPNAWRLDSYRHLGKAILAGDAEQAEHLARAYGRRLTEELEALPSEQFAPSPPSA